MLSGNFMIIRLIAGYKRKDSVKMTQNFPKPHERYNRNLKVELDLIRQKVFIYLIQQQNQIYLA